MKKTLILILLSFITLTMFAKPSSIEAREHQRTGIQINLRNYGYQNRYVVRQVYPTPLVYARPVRYCGPVYVTPGAAYVEEVYVAPAPRPFAFGGISFSLNFFR